MDFESWGSASFQSADSYSDDNGSYSGYQFPEPDYSPVEKVLIEECYCFDNQKFAERFADAIIIEAVDSIEKNRKISDSKKLAIDVLEELIDFAVQSHIDERRISYGESGMDYFDTTGPLARYFSQEGFTGWPKISEFNIKLGLEKLEDFVETWERPDDWTYCVEFLGFESEDISNYFIYEVEWSIPNPSYPIPKATACVYFSLEVSKVVPHTHDRPIEVSYIFEGSRLVHKPGMVGFEERWLRNIIEVKCAAFKKITF